MKVALYARVSTRDKDQNPETQLIQLREFCRANGWDNVQEYVDQASAKDFKNRKAWRQLMEDAAKRKIDYILVWKLDRAFRSVVDAAHALENFKHWNVSFRSYQEQWIDTTSPFGEVLFYITSAFAQLERSMIQERVKAGMDRARREGKTLGRPRVDPKKLQKLTPFLEKIQCGAMSYRQVSRETGISIGTIQRQMKAYQKGQEKSSFGSTT
ncbi:hypothetical protein BXT84_14100 [Sulfobacillus thermotolerans]|uniref:Resolvase/invertase-type recombinase catalytic domain-containing protein n=1 Tax=Sulfobacillus thermotolerans TaxID=338644 RepID=A0ABM6RU80_9FIRM|nr:hypothetical protein BXT84_14100 [Sulfobacillus thermotolerans]